MSVRSWDWPIPKTGAGSKRETSYNHVYAIDIYTGRHPPAPEERN
jgi:hypothetical protein